MGKTIVSKKYTRVRINIRPRVFGLSSLNEKRRLKFINDTEIDIENLKKDVRNKVVNLSHKLKHLVVWQMLQGEFTLGGVTRVGLPENGMSITGNNLTTFKGGPDIFFDSLVGCILANLCLHLAEPDKHFLISKAVKRTSEPIKGSRVGKERVRESRTDKFSGVCGNISTFMVAMKE